MPATTRPAVVSHSCMIADSTRQSASRRCSGSVSTSESWSELSTRAIAALERLSAPGSALTAPSLMCSPPVGQGWEILELDRAVGQHDPREDTRPARDHVVCPHRDALAEHGAAGDLGARAHAATGGHDAVAQPAALADLGAIEHHRPLH